MDIQKISWDNIAELDDIYITYLLYREGKSIEVIEKIRNYSKERIEKHIIEAKIQIHSLNNNKEKTEKSVLDRLLELEKNERLEYINKIEPKDRKILVNEIKMKYKVIKNPDDKMLLIWIIGELKEKELINIMAKDILHRNGNIRRIVCSALGKIRDFRTKNILHRALKDKKPQVRQYAAKALQNIGDESTIRILKKLNENYKEKEYVKRTFVDTIKAIENRMSTDITN